jgi:hypothetical protein
MKPIRLKIDKKGVITTIYDDRLVNLMALGKTQTHRVSDVEPMLDGSGWVAIIRNGPDLGVFKLRQQALDAEVDYLERKLGLREDDS